MDLYVVVIDDSYVRDAQVLNPESFPEDLDFSNDDAVCEYSSDPMNDCWLDCCGSIFLDVVRANSDEDAIETVSQFTGFDRRILHSIRIGD